MILLNLFIVFFRVGLFAIGGAYSFLPLLEKELVEKYHWFTKEEFVDVFGMAKIFPGAISIKFATYTGYKLAGIPGMVLANLGNILPPTLFMMLAIGVYTKYKELPGIKGAFNMIQLAVFSLVIAVAFQLVSISQITGIKNLLIIIGCFVLFTYTKVHPAIIIVGVGMVGFFLNK